VRPTAVQLPTDRGIVFLRAHADGTRSVMVCCGVEGGRPIHVFALHRRRTSLEVDPAIEWVAASPSSRYTTRMVVVSARPDGTVAIAIPGAGLPVDLTDD
jgi:hypothetical protein